MKADVDRRPRVLLADDHVLVAQGLAKLLEAEFQLIGMAQTGRELLDLMEANEPDVVILDISMPEMNGLVALRHMRKTWPKVPVLITSMHSDPQYVSTAMRDGASGYILKRSAASELVKALRTVLVGEQYVGPGINESPGMARSTDPLTPRQTDVLRLVANGCSAKEVAAQLDISTKTVEFHKSALMDRLGVRTVAQLTKYALDHGIIEP